MRDKEKVFNLEDFITDNTNIDKFFKGTLDRPGYKFITHPTKITKDYVEKYGQSRGSYYDSITYEPSVTLEEKKSILEYIKKELLEKYKENAEIIKQINDIIDGNTDELKNIIEYYEGKKNIGNADEETAAMKRIDGTMIMSKVDALFELNKENLTKGGKKYRRKSRVQKKTKKAGKKADKKTARRRRIK